MYFLRESICFVCIQVGVCASPCWYNLRGRWRTVGALQGIATWQECTHSKANKFAQYFYESLSSAGPGRDDLTSSREAVGGRSFQLSLYLGSGTWVTSSQSWRESPWAPHHTQHVILHLSCLSTASDAASLYGLTIVQNLIASMQQFQHKHFGLCGITTNNKENSLAINVNHTLQDSTEFVIR